MRPLVLQIAELQGEKFCYQRLCDLDLFVLDKRQPEDTTQTLNIVGINTDGLLWHGHTDSHERNLLKPGPMLLVRWNFFSDTVVGILSQLSVGPSEEGEG